MECVFKDMYALESFIETIDGMFTVKQKQVCYVLDELRREAFFSDEILAEGLALGKQEAKLKYTEVSKSKKESH